MIKLLRKLSQAKKGSVSNGNLTCISHEEIETGCDKGIDPHKNHDLYIMSGSMKLRDENGDNNKGKDKDNENLVISSHNLELFNFGYLNTSEQSTGSKEKDEQKYS